MSKSINLVTYATVDDGKLYETKTDLVESAFVTPSLLGELQKEFPLAEKKIFEKIGSEDHYSIECFNDCDIEGILKKLEEMFLSILKSDSGKLLHETDSNNSENLPSTHSKHIIPNDIKNSISRFRTLTNIINVFELKYNKYRNDASAVVKIG